MSVEDPRWIEEGRALQEYLEEVLDARPVLALDTESSHFRAYTPRICLIQLAGGETGGEVAFVDPISEAMEDGGLESLFEVLEDPAVEKVLHSARNDLGELDRDYQRGLRGLFDTELAARFLGYRRSKLSWLTEEVLGVKIPDGMQKFDWTTRPLPKKALRYAGSDVDHLLELRDRLAEELAESPWWQAFEETCEWVARETRYQERPFDPERWRRIKAAKNFNGRQRARLQELYRWRHEVCEERNLAAFLVVPDHHLAGLSKRPPRSMADLKGGKKHVQKLSEREQEQLLETLERAEKIDEPPAELPRRGERPGPRERARFEALRKWRNAKAKEFDLPSEFIATNDTLTQVAAAPPEEVSDLEGFDDLLQWQVELFGEELVEVAILGDRED